MALDGAPDAPTAAVPSQQAAVIAHLNAVLGWSRLAQESSGWVLQPTDGIYETTQHDLNSEVVTNAFAYARGMVAVIGDEASPAAKKPEGDRATRLTSLEATNSRQLSALRAEEADLQAKIADAQPQDRAALTGRLDVVTAEVDLDTAIGDSLEKATSLTSETGEGGKTDGFAAQVAALQRASPAGTSASAGKAPAAKAAQKPPVASSSEGLFNRAATLFSLVRDRREIEVLEKRTSELEAAANGLAEPVAAQIRAAMAEGRKAGDDASQLADAAQMGQARDRIESATARFRALSGALIPLRQEVSALDQTRENLAEWQRSIVAETNVIIRVFLGRAVGLAIALAVILAISEVWRRATFRYVHDLRRRRQFLLVRRFATAILMVVIIAMGFVSNFSSFATFAGFITAGIAVALQSIILSVAAYFFLIGRYGVRVGDRVTVSGVTGDVIDIGLVRVFLMELAGTGIDLHPTGRVVVLANSALFSTTPLYKQLPGTDYTWHEVFVTMAADSETSKIEEVLLKAVNSIYGGYRTSIERQHGDLERILDYKTDLPVPTGHIRYTDSGLEVVIRYPAELRKMSEIDEKVTKQVLAALSGNEQLRKSLSTMPRIRAAVKT
jgi:small-conductance mechanosensitive channel